MDSRSFKQAVLVALLAAAAGCSKPDAKAPAPADAASPSTTVAPSPAATEPAASDPSQAKPSGDAPSSQASPPSKDAPAQSAKNMTNIAHGILNFEADKRVFPRRTINAVDGGALLSWRVAILPFIGQEALYAEFHLNEPWDSPHNKALLDRMPAAYDSPMTDAGPGMTNYLAVTGEKAVLSDAQDVTLVSISDGAVNTVMVVEADKAVPWTSPNDFAWTEDDPDDGLGGLHPDDVFLTCIVTGAAHYVTTDSQPHEITALFTRNGGDPVDWARQPEP